MSHHIAIKMYDSDNHYKQYLLDLIGEYLGEKLGHIKDRNQLKKTINLLAILHKS